MRSIISIFTLIIEIKEKKFGAIIDSYAYTHKSGIKNENNIEKIRIVTEKYNGGIGNTLLDYLQQEVCGEDGTRGDGCKWCVG